MPHKKPSWMEQEEERAENLADTGQTSNESAPKLVRVTKEPARMQKAFYIQEKYAKAFEDFVYKRRKKKGKKAPQFAEEALKLLLDKYGEDTNDL